ncbi:MAG: hypothetical protein HYZ49_13100 [Chloroflexi bacterium]|nr:hypothetical protein [Chloroflexota bacterium]
MLFVKTFLGYWRVLVGFDFIRRIDGINDLSLCYHKLVAGEYFELFPRMLGETDGH